MQRLPLLTTFVLGVMLGHIVPATSARASDLDTLAALERRSNELAAAGRGQQALEVAQQMVTFAEQRLKHDPRYIGLAWNDVAIRYLELEDFTKAERAASKAQEILQANLGPQDSAVADALTNLGNAHLGLKQHRKALAEHQRALQIRVRTKGSRSGEAADSFENVAVILADVGRHADAEPFYRQALAVKTDLYGGRHEAIAQLHFNLGHGYLQQRRFDLAESYLKHSLHLYESLRGPNYVVIARVATHLSRACRFTRQLKEAEALALRAASILLKAHGPDSPVVATDHELADVYFAQGRFAEAEENYRRVLKYHEAHLGQDKSEMAIVLMDLAQTYSAQKHWDEAIQAADRAISLLTATENAAMLNHFYLRRGMIRMALERKDSLEDFRRAIEASESMRSQFSGDDAARAESFVLFSHAYWEAALCQLRAGDIAGAFADLERARTRSLVDQMKSAHVDLLAGIPPERARELNAAQSRAEIQLASLEQQWKALDAPSAPSKEELENKRNELTQSLSVARRELTEAKTALRNASPAYRQAVGRDFQPTSLAEVETWLRQRQSLMLYYVDLPDQCYVVSIGRAGSAGWTPLAVSDSQAARLEIEAGELNHDKLKHVLLSKETGVLPKLADPGRAAEANDQLAALWQVLIPEADRGALLDGTYKSLVIVTCASLYSLPIETLVTSTEGAAQYLLDSGPPVLYAPSATILLNLAGQKRAETAGSQPPILTVGDPDYGSGGKFSRLPHTATESHWVKEAYAKCGQAATQLLRGQATEDAVRAQISNRRVVHLACHGRAEETYGNLFGSLVLAPTQRNTTADDGNLTLGEIYSLDLRGCELAILSACQTNYGPQQLSEGAWALTRGFLVAGSRRVVSSNWVVDDEAAATLIYYFAHAAAKGEKLGDVNHALALQSAKRAIRKQEAWRSPYFWGPFVLVGPQ